jgi:hypothetical protein
MFNCFFDHQGTVHFKFLEQGQTVNQNCYLEILARLCEAVPGEDLNFGLMHDVLTVREFLAKKSILKLDHPPDSPHLTPCDFWLFPKFKTALKGHRFSDINDIQRHATTILKDIPEEVFQKCFEQAVETPTH